MPPGVLVQAAPATRLDTKNESGFIQVRRAALAPEAPPPFFARVHFRGSRLGLLSGALRAGEPSMTRQVWRLAHCFTRPVLGAFIAPAQIGLQYKSRSLTLLYLPERVWGPEWKNRRRTYKTAF